MSSIITAVFKATIGLLVNKGRDKVAEKLKDGDVTDQKFRGLIVREIDDIKSKLDGLARKDLLASISFFKEGIELLYEVFDKPRSRGEYGMATTQAVSGIAGAEAVSLAKGMKKLELADPGETTSWALANAKDRFKDARRKATEAFNNEAMELSDRVLAMQYRLMASILETVDNPVNALPTCRVCIEELHRLSAVKDCFTVELKQGLWARFSKAERRALISSTCHMNRVIYDVMLLVCFGNKQLSANNWPCIDTRKEKIDLLRDHRVARVLEKQGVKQFCVPWSLFSEEDEHGPQWLLGMAKNRDGQFIIGDNGDKTVKVFDSSGHYIFKLGPHTDDDKKKTLVRIFDVATDEDSNIYALVSLEIGYSGATVLVYNGVGYQLLKFPVKRSGDWGRLSVSRSKLLVAWYGVIHVYETSGLYVRSFGGEILKNATDITAGPDDRVLVLDKDDNSINVFTEDGQQLSKFSIRTKGAEYYRVACHPGGEHVIVAGKEREEYPDTYRLLLEVYTKDGEYQRTVALNEKVYYRVNGITVSREGCIVVAFDQRKVIVL